MLLLILTLYSLNAAAVKVIKLCYYFFPARTVFTGSYATASCQGFPSLPRKPQEKKCALVVFSEFSFYLKEHTILHFMCYDKCALVFSMHKR